MIRLVLGENGALEVDLAGRTFGRGAWVHARPECLEGAARAGASKAFKTNVRVAPAVVLESLRRAADRRVESLIGSARGAGLLAPGSEAAHAAFENRSAKLLVVTDDARAAAQASWVMKAAGEGAVAVWGTKERLGRAVGRAETAIIAIQDTGFADSLRHAIALSKMPESTDGRVDVEQARAEVR